MRRLVPALLVLLAAVPASAEVEVHLKSGKVLVVDDAWRQGRQVLLERDGRIEAIPDDMVVSIGPPAKEPVPGEESPATPPRGEPAAGVSADELLRALAHEQAGRLGEAESAYARIVQRDPSNIHAAVGLARVRLAQGREQAAEAALALLWLDPEPDPRGLAILGEIRYRQERLQEAVELWERAVERWDDAGLREVLAKARRELGAATAYRSAGSAHFRLQHSGEGRSPHEREILSRLEQAYTRISLEFGGGPSQITVILYTEQDFRQATEAPDWVGGLFDGKVRVPARDLDPGDLRLQEVLAHELAHAFVHHLSGGKAPRWLHEGIAEHFEGASALEHEPGFAREYRQTRGRGWGESFTYPKALSLVEYMLGLKGMGGIGRVLEALAAGGSEEDAIRRVYHMDRDRLMREWGESLARKHPE